MKNYFDYTDEKITEKAFLQSVTISVIGILLCIILFCSTTYAWFTSNISSNSNTLTSGSFDLEVSVTYDGAEITDFAKNANGSFTYTFEKIGTYTVELEMTDSSNVKGYCKVSVNDGAEEITNSISKDGTGVNPFVFTIITTEKNTEVCFTPQWGRPASPTIQNKNG